MTIAPAERRRALVKESKRYMRREISADQFEKAEARYRKSVAGVFLRRAQDGWRVVKDTNGHARVQTAHK